MTDTIGDKIQAELKQIDEEMAAQKKVLKRSVGNQIVIETAELELKALHTRRKRLETNLQKSQASHSSDGTRQRLLYQVADKRRSIG
jgi:hypothetical protein